MAGYLRIRSPWSQLGVFIAVFSPQLLLLVYGMMSTTTPRINLDDPAVISSLKWVQAFSSILFFLLPAFLYAVFTFRGRYFHFLGMRKPERLNMFALAIVCILLAWPFVLWLGELNQHIPLPRWMTNMEDEAAKQMAAFLSVKSPVDVILNVFVIAFLPAVCEELFFRGALQRILIQVTASPWAGIIITATLFSALHLQFEGFLPRVFLGIILGALYWYSGSLWTNILAHFMNNAFQVLLVSYVPKFINQNPSIPVSIQLLSGIGALIILYFYRRQSSVTFSKVYRAPELTSFYDEFPA